ncbi:unnamed protein product [Anisakis simplex]|uniref:SEA domain-containing protein n=1 Tax=Anisakis simplex TaxID=6269 RepID=A0A3P6SF41_ANISI|nr:unnamed protein product [Anisakis simplex]
MNRIFQHSNVHSHYAGSEVTQFRFVPAVPALDVSFNVRLRSTVSVDVLDLLSIMRNYLSARGFDGNTIDIRSISLEPSQR